MPFDKLILATGAAPVQPDIEGLSLTGVFQLHTMEDAFRVKEYLKDAGAASAIIVGAGYIGVEMADALSHLGMRVTLVGKPASFFRVSIRNWARSLKPS